MKKYTPLTSLSKWLLIGWLCGNIAFAQLPWPSFPFNQQPDITGTVGEFRGSTSSPRFHKGVDITNGSDFRIFAVWGGRISASGGSGCNKYIDIEDSLGTTRYYHIDAVATSGTVAQGQLIGSMTTVGGCAIHLHIQRNGENLLENAFFPFTDQTLPTLYAWSIRENGHSLTRNAARYSTDSEIDGIRHRIIGNKVDLVLNADDTRLNPQGQSPGVGAVAPYQLDYQILDAQARPIGDTVLDNLDFGKPTLNAHAGKVFGVSSNSGNYNWILTSHPSIAPADRYWNTGIRQGESENWANTTALDAPLNAEARYPDGAYMIRFRARDVDFDSDSSGGYNQAVLEVPVVVDNFRPYVQQVTYRQATGLKDSALWRWDGTNLNFESDSVRIQQGAALELTIQTSEAMKEVTLSIADLNFQERQTQAIASSEGKSWLFRVDSSYVSNPLSCQPILQIAGLDLADNPLQSDPRNLAIRQGAATWQPSPTAANDQNHHFFMPLGCTVSKEEELRKIDVAIFPNPATEKVYINLPELSEPVAISVWDVHGKCILKQATFQTQRISFDTASWPRGLYWVQLTHKKSSLSKLLYLVD